MTRTRKKKASKSKARGRAAGGRKPSRKEAPAGQPAGKAPAQATRKESPAELLERLARARQEQRLSTPPLKGEGQPPAVAVVHLFRLPPRGTRLVPVPQRELPPGFEMPSGVAREAEGHLGRADVAAALAAGRRMLEGQPAAIAGNEPTPEAVDAITVLVRAYLLEGRTEDARRAMGAWADHPALALCRANLALSEGEGERAQENLVEALKRRPEGVAEHHVLALFKAAVGEAREAMALLARVSAHVPEHAVARHLLGKLTADEGDPARAGTLFEQAWELAPGFVAPALTLAEMFTDARQYGEAMNILNLAAERAPSLLAPRLMQLRILVDARRTAPALPLAEALRQAAPGREDVVLLWAEALLLAERAAEVRKRIRESVADGTLAASGRVHAMLARAAMAEKPADTRGARDHLEAAVEAEIPRAEWLLELAGVQAQQQDLAAARKSLERLENLEELELSSVVNGAVAATRHGFPDISQRLQKMALEHVRGTPQEFQVRSLLSAL